MAALAVRCPGLPLLHCCNMAKLKLKKRLVVRIDAPLVNKLKFCAERDGRVLSNWVRKVADAAAASTKGRGRERANDRH
jgi:hypothetical protein